MTIEAARKIAWTHYPVRTCKSLHHCELCNDQIVLSEFYHDGGYGRRVHVKCRTDLIFKEREEALREGEEAK